MTQLTRTLLAGILAVVGGSAVERGQPSRTALGAAVGRAIGAKHPDPQFRNPDYLAIRFLEPHEHSLAAALPEGIPPGILDLDYDAAMKQYPNPPFIPAMLFRTRYFDERLDEALRGGARQVVVLGAGLDSRGYRFKDRLRGVKFFEVDYGPTQEYKKQRVREVFGRLPKRIRYVAMDFAKNDLLTELAKYGYSPEKRRSLSGRP
jgi:methyltransferase (TIGR00027 family)